MEFEQQLKMQDEAWRQAQIHIETSFKSDKKYISNFESEEYRFYSLKQIKAKIYDLILNRGRFHVFIHSLKEVNPIIRDGRIHDVRCEFAMGNSCDCWCGEKFHGLKGVGIQNDEVVN